VRELENVICKALLAAQGYSNNLDHVRTTLNETSGAGYSAARSFGEYIDEVLAAARRDELSDAHARVLETAERELFARAIQQTQGNQAKAARWLGVTRVTMRAKPIQFGLHPSQD
jgi:DNA-binding NtrC family response regulator